MLSNAEKRASDEVSALSQRVYRLQVGNMSNANFILSCAYSFFFVFVLLTCFLQATLDTVQSTEEVREVRKSSLILVY